LPSFRRDFVVQFAFATPARVMENSRCNTEIEQLYYR